MQTGQVLAWLHTGDAGKLPDAEAMFRSALTWGEAQPARQKLIFGVVR